MSAADPTAEAAAHATKRAPARRPTAGSLAERLALWGTLAALALLVLYPLGMLVLRSFQDEDLAGFTLANYVEVFQTPELLQTLGNSLLIASGATVLSVLLGVSLAWINARTDSPGSRIFANLNLIPFFTPPFVGAFAWTIIASKNQGLINNWAAALFGTTEPLVNIYTPAGIIFVLGIYDAPLVYLFVAGAFRKMDPSLEDASRMAGAGAIETTLRITLPLTLPAIVAAAMLIFVTTLGAFEVPLILGIPGRFSVLTTELFAAISEYPARYNLASAMCSLLLLFTVIALIIQRRVVLRRSFVTVTGKAYQPRRMNIGLGRYLAFGWNLTYLSIAVLLPMFALLVLSFERVWTGSIRWENFSLVNYHFIFVDFDVGPRALLNTLILATVGATLGTILGIVTAYLTLRGRVAGRGVLDLLSGLPLAVPGAILAVGIAICWIKSPIYGTLFIILIAYVAKFSPYAQRSVGATLLSISPELDECSRVSGASWWRTMRDVLLPLLKPGIIGGWLLLFIIIMRELGMALFLYRIGTETVPIAMYLLMLDTPTATAALCVMQIAVILLAVIIMRRVSRDDEFTL